MKQLLSLLFLFLIPFDAFATEAYEVQFHRMIRLPSDETERHQLLTSIDGFLRDMDVAKEESEYVDADHLTDSMLFFEELHDYSAYARIDDENFFVAQLLSATPLEEGRYELQIALMGAEPDSPPLLRLLFRVEAERKGSLFQFRSLVERHANQWDHATVGNVSYVYEHSLDEERAQRFDAFNTMLAGKLNVPVERVSYVHCRSTQEILAYLGIDYHLQINGRAKAAFNTRYDFLSGRNEEGYEHDLLHVYFEEKFGREKTYRPFEEGVAAFYAGSWGDSYETILGFLTDYIETHPEVDLRTAYDERVRLGRHDIRYAINALLAEEVERRHGFDALIDVLHSGKDGASYFEKLEKKLGFAEANLGSFVRGKLSERI